MIMKYHGLSGPPSQLGTTFCKTINFMVLVKCTHHLSLLECDVCFGSDGQEVLETVDDHVRCRGHGWVTNCQGNTSKVCYTLKLDKLTWQPSPRSIFWFRGFQSLFSFSVVIFHQAKRTNIWFRDGIFPIFHKFALSGGLLLRHRW